MVDAKFDEEPIAGKVFIVDSHHHLHDRAHGVGSLERKSRYLLDEYLAAIGPSPRVIATVCVESHMMYRASGPAETRSVGETEFFNGQAAMSASGLYGPCRVGAGIISNADLRLGDLVRHVLEAHIAAAPARLRGIRQGGMWDQDESIVGFLFDNGPHMYLREDFRRGFSHLAPLGLSFDAFVLAPQMPDVADLAMSFSDTAIILNHLGNPVGIGRHRGRLAEEFPQWKLDLGRIARCPNVFVKLGGLGTFLSHFPSFRADPPVSSAALADEWRPYVETAVELFGPSRCMFESNFPTDQSGPFSNVCNAYQRITRQYSDSDNAAIFAGTAARVYKLDIPELER